MPTTDPDYQSHDESHPDPGAVDQLAQKWLTMGADLYHVGAKIPEAINAVDWVGDGREAAATAAGKVAGIVNQTAENCVTLGNGLKEYAENLRKTLAAEKAAMIAEIIGIVFTFATFGIGGLLTQAIAKLAELIANVLSKLGSVLGLSGDLAGFSAFAAGCIVWGGVTAGIDVSSQLIGDAVAGADIHIDPAMVVANAVIGGLAGGLGSIGDPALVQAIKNGGRPGGSSLPNVASDVPNPAETHIGGPNSVSGGLQAITRPPAIEFTGGRPRPGDSPRGNSTVNNVHTPTTLPSRPEPVPTGSNGVRTPAPVEVSTTTPRPGNTSGDSVTTVRPPDESRSVFPGRGNPGHGPADGSNLYVNEGASHPVPTTRTPATGINAGEPPRVTATRSGPAYDQPATFTSPPRGPAEPSPANSTADSFSGRGTPVKSGPTDAVQPGRGNTATRPAPSSTHIEPEPSSGPTTRPAITETGETVHLTTRPAKGEGNGPVGRDAEAAPRDVKRVVQEVQVYRVDLPPLDHSAVFEGLFGKGRLGAGAGVDAAGLKSGLKSVLADLERGGLGGGKQVDPPPTYQHHLKDGLLLEGPPHPFDGKTPAPGKVGLPHEERITIGPEAAPRKLDLKPPRAGEIGSPHIDPHAIEDVMVRRREWVEQNIGGEAHVRVPADTHRAPVNERATGGGKHAQVVDPDYDAAAVARAQHDERVRGVMSNNARDLEEAHLGIQPGGMVYKPDGGTGAALTGPPSRFQQIREGLEQVVMQRRPLLDERTRLGGDANAVQRLADIDVKLSQLQVQEQNLASEYARRYGTPHIRPGVEGTPTTRPEVERALNHVSDQRRAIMVETASGQHAATPSPAPATRLSDLDVQEAGLLDRVRQLQHEADMENISRAMTRWQQLGPEIQAANRGLVAAFRDGPPTGQARADLGWRLAAEDRLNQQLTDLREVQANPRPGTDVSAVRGQIDTITSQLRTINTPEGARTAQQRLEADRIVASSVVADLTTQLEQLETTAALTRGELGAAARQWVRNLRSGAAQAAPWWNPWARHAAPDWHHLMEVARAGHADAVRVRDETAQALETARHQLSLTTEALGLASTVTRQAIWNAVRDLNALIREQQVIDREIVHLLPGLADPAQRPLPGWALPVTTAPAAGTAGHGTGGVPPSELPELAHAVGPDWTVSAWLADGREIAVHRVPERGGGPAGVALVPSSELDALGDGPLLPPGRGVAVFVHGGPDLVRVAVVRSPGQPPRYAYLTAEDLARVLGGVVEAGAPLVLVACDTGAIAGGFAQRMATAWGADVLAPQEPVNVGSAPAPAIRSAGGQPWRLFVPGGLGGEGFDVINDDIAGAAPFDGITSVPAADVHSGLWLSTQEPDLAPDEAPLTIAQLYDLDDAGMVFAPPADAVRPGLRQAVGPETVEVASRRALYRIGRQVRSLFPEAQRVEVDRLLAARFNELTVESEGRQLVGDRLTFTLRPGGKPVTVSIMLRRGSWTQVTDPRGRLLVDPAQFGDFFHQAAKAEARTRQVLDWAQRTGVSLPSSSGVTVEGAIGGEHGRGNHFFQSFPATVRSGGPALRDTAVLGISVETKTTSYVKGSAYRAVDFVFDLVSLVTVSIPGQALTQSVAVVPHGLVSRFNRTVVVAHAPSADDTYADANRWRQLTGRADAVTADQRRQMAALGRRLAGKLAPDSVPAPTDRRLVVPASRLWWVETVSNATDTRVAVDALMAETVSPSLVEPGKPSAEALANFSAVQTQMGGLLEDTYTSPTLFTTTWTGATKADAAQVRVEFFNPRVIDPYDERSRPDAEDVFVTTAGLGLSQADAADLTFVPGWGLQDNLTNRFAVSPVMPQLNTSREVGQSRPGRNSTLVVLHKLKFTDEPTALIEFDVRRTVSSVTNPDRQREVWDTVKVRMFVADAAELRDADGAPLVVGDPNAHGVTSENPAEIAKRTDRRLRRDSSRQMRLPDLFDGRLFPNTRVSWVDPTAARHVLRETMAAIRERHPGWLDNPLFWQRRGTGLPALTGPQQLAALDNHQTLTSLLTPQGLARIIHPAVNGGHPILLPNPGWDSSALLRVRVHATYQHRTFAYRRPLGGQMEVYNGHSAGAGGGTSSTWAGNTTAEVSFAAKAANTGEPRFDPEVNRTVIDFTPGDLKEVDLRVGGRLGMSRSTAQNSGLNAGGAIGGGSAWLSEFDGEVTFSVVIEQVSTTEADAGPAPAPAPAPASATGTGVDATAAYNAAPGLEAGTLRTAVATGPLRVVEQAVPIRLLVSEDIVEEHDPRRDEWAPSVTFGIYEFDTASGDPIEVTDFGAADLATVHRRINPLRHQPRTFDPAAGTGTGRPVAAITQNSLFMPDVQGIMPAIRAGFRTAGFRSLPLAVDAELETLVATLAARSDQLVGGPEVIWTGRLRRPRAAAVKYEVLVELVPIRLDGIGESKGAYTYLHSLAGARVSRSDKADNWVPTALWGMTFPVQSRGGLVFNPSFSVTGKKEGPRTVTDYSGGAFDRVDIDVDPHVWFTADLTYRVTVRPWQRPTATPDPAADLGTPIPVASRGLGLMPLSQARERNLADIGAPPVPDPLAVAPAAPGTLGPPTNTLRGDGIGNSIMPKVPDSRGFFTNLIGAVWDRHPDVIAEAVDTELRKLRGVVMTRAMLESLLAGITLLVPVRDAITTTYVQISLGVDLTFDQHLGQTAGVHVLERKNVRSFGQEEGRDTGYSVDITLPNLRFSHPGVAREAVRDVGFGGAPLTYSFGGKQSQQAVTGGEESLGLLHVGRFEEFSFTATFTGVVTVLATVPGAPGAIRDAVGLSPAPVADQPVRLAATETLVLAYPRALVGPPGPNLSARVNGLVTRRPLLAGQRLDHDRAGLPLTADLLHEVDVESIGNLRWLKRVGAALFAPQNLTAAQLPPRAERTLVQRANDALHQPNSGAASWFASPARLVNSVDTVLDPAYLSRWLIRMLLGEGKSVPLIVPGILYGVTGTFEIMADIRGWRIADPLTADPAQNAVLRDTITKDFQRAIHHALSGMSKTHGWSGNFTPVSLTWALNASRVPDPAAPGVLDKFMAPIVTAGASARHTAAANSAGTTMMLEAGDKHTGRSMTRIEVTRLDWHLAWRRDSDGAGEVFTTSVVDEALMLYAPTENVTHLMGLTPRLPLPGPAHHVPHTYPPQPVQPPDLVLPPPVQVMPPPTSTTTATTTTGALTSDSPAILPPDTVPPVIVPSEIVLQPEPGPSTSTQASTTEPVEGQQDAALSASYFQPGLGRGEPSTRGVRGSRGLRRRAARGLRGLFGAAGRGATPSSSSTPALPAPEQRYSYDQNLPPNPHLYWDGTDQYRIAAPGLAGDDLIDNGQFCFLLATQWLGQGGPAQGLRFGDLSRVDRDGLVDRFMELAAAHRDALDGQLEQAALDLSGVRADGDTVRAAINHQEWLPGTQFWFGNRGHAMAAVIGDNRAYLVYDPNTGRTQTLGAPGFLKLLRDRAMDSFVVRLPRPVEPPETALSTTASGLPTVDQEPSTAEPQLPTAVPEPPTVESGLAPPPAGVEPAVLTRGAEGGWLAGGLPIEVYQVPARGGRSAGVAAIPRAEWEALGEDPLLPAGAGVPVFVHGGGDLGGDLVRVPVGGAPDGNPRFAYLTAEDLARVLADRVGPDAMLILVACDTGAVAGGFAQRLATARGADVLAPQERVNVGSPQAPQVSSPRGEPWLLFVPEGLAGEGFDVVNDDVPGVGPVPFDGITSVPAAAAGSGLWLSGPPAPLDLAGDTSDEYITADEFSITDSETGDPRPGPWRPLVAGSVIESDLDTDTSFVTAPLADSSDGTRSDHGHAVGDSSEGEYEGSVLSQEDEVDEDFGAPLTLTELYDEADEGKVFAPPADAVRPGLRQAVGPETVEVASENALRAIQREVELLFPRAQRAEVRRLVAERISESTVEAESRQLLGDRLTFTISPGGTAVTVSIMLRRGDWVQVTDPHGRLLARPGRYGDFFHQAAKREARTRQVLDWAQGSGVTLSSASGGTGEAAIGGSQGRDNRFFQDFAATLRSGYVARRDGASLSVSTETKTTSYVKGSAYRAVDFVFDLVSLVTMSRPGHRLEYRVATVAHGLLSRYNRTVVASAPAPPGRDYATSAMVRRGHAGRDAATADQHAALLTLAHQLLVGAAPAVRAGPAGANRPVLISRLWWVETVANPGDTRQVTDAMMTGAVSTKLAAPGTASAETLANFSSVQTQMGGLLEGTYTSPTLFATTRAGTTTADAAQVRVEFFNPRVIDPFDQRTRPDAEDVFVTTAGLGVSQADAADLTGVPGFGLREVVAGEFGVTPVMPQVSSSREVSQSRPGRNSTLVVLHKLKFTDEPTALIEFDVRRTVSTVKGQPPRRVWDTVKVRMFVVDAVRLTDAAGLPLAVGERYATVNRPTDPAQIAKRADGILRRATGRRLRLTTLFDGVLFPNTRVSHIDPTAAAHVLDDTLRIIRADHPGWLDSPAAQQVAALDNYRTLANLLSPQGLARILHPAVNGGHSILLPNPGWDRGALLRVRVRASFDRHAFRYRRTLGGQMEVYNGYYANAGGATSSTWSGNVTGEATFAVKGANTGTPGIDPVTSQPSTSFHPGDLKEVDLRAGIRLGMSRGSDQGSGLNAGGAIGGGSPWLSEFRGPVTFEVTVEQVAPDGAAPPAIPPAPPPARLGRFGAGPRLEAGPLAPGAPRPQATPLRRVDIGLLVTEDLAEERDPVTGQWAPSVTFGIYSVDPRGGAPTEVTDFATADLSSLQRRVDPARHAPRSFDPATSTLPPITQNSLFMPDVQRVMPAIRRGFANAGFARLPLAIDAELETLVATLSARSDQLIGGPESIWNGHLPGAQGPARYEVLVELSPTGLDAIGLSQGSYTYLHSLAGARVSLGESRDNWVPTGLFGLNFPVQSFHGLVFNPSFSVSARKDGPSTVKDYSGGAFDRVDIDVAPHVWFTAALTYRVTVRPWQQPSLTPPPAAPAAVGIDVAARGLGLMPLHQALLRGLAPATAALPADPDAAAPGTVQPPTNTLRGDGIGNSIMPQVPDSRPFYDQVIATAWDRYPAFIADAIDAELRKLRGVVMTRALLESLLAGVTLLVPVRDEQTTSYVQIALGVDLSYGGHLGHNAGAHVLERKNVRTYGQEQSHQSGYSLDISLPSVRFSQPGAVREVVRDVGFGGNPFGYSLGGNRDQQTLTGGEESLGLLHVGQFEEFSFVATFRAVITIYSALPGAVGAIGDRIGFAAPPVAAPTVSVAAAVDLVLAYPREILGPPRPLPAPRVNGVIHRRPLPAGHSLSDDRMGLPLTADLLHEVDVESIGNLRWLKQVGAALFAPGGPTAAQVLPAPPDTLVRRLNDALLMPSAAANSWFASPARLLNSVDTVLDPAYLSRWLVRMLIGAGKPVPLVVPGLVYGTHGTFEIMADIRHWRVANPLAPGPAAGPAGVLPNTIVKDFQRAIRNAVSSISGSHGWSGNVTPLSLTWALNADSVPDPAAPGVLNKLMVPIVTAGLSARRGVGANSAGQKMLVEAGDKHTGRSMTRIEVTSVDWHLAWRPDTGEGEVFKTTVDGEAIVVYVPTQNVPPLLALAPKVALPIGPPPRASYPPRPSATARPPYPRLTRGPATSRTSEPSTSRLAMDHREPLDTWVSIMDWAESATFFASHQNELVTAGNREALAARTPATDPGRWGILAALLAEEFGGWAGLGYDYLVAATPEEGIKQVLPALVRWPVLFAPTAELVDAVSVVRGDGGYHAVLLRATRHALAGETEAARALVKSVRGRVLPSVKISWIDLLAPLAEPTQPDSAAVNALREELTGCAIPTRNPPQ